VRCLEYAYCMSYHTPPRMSSISEPLGLILATETWWPKAGVHSLNGSREAQAADLAKRTVCCLEPCFPVRRVWRESRRKWLPPEGLEQLHDASKADINVPSPSATRSGLCSQAPVHGSKNTRSEEVPRAMVKCLTREWTSSFS
jgi:hypothetical protein